MEQFRTVCKVEEVNEELGLVFGWAIVCAKGGEPYFDLQGDHIPEDAMLKAATDFMVNSRQADVMHDEVPSGQIVYALPLTEDVKKAFGMKCDKTGLAVVLKPDEETFAKFKSGELTGFSIGGYRGEDEEVPA